MSRGAGTCGLSETCGLNSGSTVHNASEAPGIGSGQSDGVRDACDGKQRSEDGEK